MKEEKILHLCLKAPTDFLAWIYLKNGEKCKQCGNIIKKEGM